MDDDKDKYLLHWHTKPCLSYPTFLPSSILQWLLFALAAISCPFTPLCFFISYFYGWNGFPSLLYLVKKLKVLVTQSCLTLCDPIACSPPGFSVPGILQERILGWVAIHFSMQSSQARDQTRVSFIAGEFFTVWATKEAHNSWPNAICFMSSFPPTDVGYFSLCGPRTLCIYLKEQFVFMLKWQHFFSFIRIICPFYFMTILRASPCLCIPSDGHKPDGYIFIP